MNSVRGFKERILFVHGGPKCDNLSLISISGCTQADEACEQAAIENYFMSNHVVQFNLFATNCYAVLLLMLQIKVLRYNRSCRFSLLTHRVELLHRLFLLHDPDSGEGVYLCSHTVEGQVFESTAQSKSGFRCGRQEQFKVLEMCLYFRYTIYCLGMQ